jgi:hypothetical protein
LGPLTLAAYDGRLLKGGEVVDGHADVEPELEAVLALWYRDGGELVHEGADPGGAEPGRNSEG